MLQIRKKKERERKSERERESELKRQRAETAQLKRRPFQGNTQCSQKSSEPDKGECTL